MSTDLSPLNAVEKLLFDVPLAPVQGRRFQPTGFPDLGAATFESNGGTCLLVESAQSMANRLEAVCWDEATSELLPELKGLSYVRVVDGSGAFLTSTVTEAHRLNSVYIERADAKKFHETLKKEIGLGKDKDKPIKRGALTKVLLAYDVGSLIHGVFLESIDGRLRVSRALSAFIEAERATIVASGGVKNDHVRPGTEAADGKERRTAAEGFGNVPFHRDEYTAESITLFANVDLAQLRGYGLGDEATRMLTLLSLFKLRSLLDGRLRLRTACDFKVVGDSITATNAGFALPPRAALLAELRTAITKCAPQMAKNDGVTTVTYAD